MKNLKHELQDLIFRNEPAGQAGQLQKVQRFLRGHAETSFAAEKQQRFKGEETAALLIYADQEELVYQPEILERDFISEGAEQRVYRLNGSHVIKTNAGIFYEFWLD